MGMTEGKPSSARESDSHQEISQQPRNSGGPKTPSSEQKKPTPPTGPKPAKAASPTASTQQTPAQPEPKPAPVEVKPAVAAAPEPAAPQDEASSESTRTKINARLTVDDFELLTVVGKGASGMQNCCAKAWWPKLFL